MAMSLASLGGAHALSPEECLIRLRSRPQGLSEAEARERLARYGPNVLRPSEPVPGWKVLVGQLQSVVVLLLFAAAAIALAVGEPLNALAIAAVLLINTALGFLTELRAHRAIEALLELEVLRATAVREGAVREIDARDLVPGDIIEVEAGQSVPADARLLAATELETDKLRVVQALQRAGEIVAMLGDGVNDAAALKQAEIGVAMGIRGTDLAKETAAVVLQDDRFPTVAAAVEEGRVIFDNIRKFVFYLFSCNLAEVLVLLVAGLVALPLPLLPLQILWLNMVTDTFPALALALEPAEPDVMLRPPRDPQATVLSVRFLRAIGFYGALITAVTLGAFVWGLNARPEDPAHARTLAFTTLAFAQLFHLGNARSAGPVTSPRRVAGNVYALGAVTIVLALQLAAVYLPPLSDLLAVRPLELREWLLVGPLSVLPAVVGQARKVARVRGAA